MHDHPAAQSQSGFARIAEALADPAREAIVAALADGEALPAGELARAARISPQSASAHLQKLVDARILSVWSQGRFRYYRVADEEVAAVIESLVNLAARSDSLRGRRPRVAAELRYSRSCYHHLAGELGVAFANALVERRYVVVNGQSGMLTDRGRAWCRAEEISFTSASSSGRGADIRLCMDWTERRPHFAGALPNAILRHLTAGRYLVTREIPRAFRVTEKGHAFLKRLGIRAKT